MNSVIRIILWISALCTGSVLFSRVNKINGLVHITAIMAKHVMEAGMEGWDMIMIMNA